MLDTLKQLGKRLRLRSLGRGDMTDGDAQVENTDAMAASHPSAPDGSGGRTPGTVPPNYIKTYDEGRPRH